MFYEWTSMTTGRADRLASSLQATSEDSDRKQAEREAKLKSIALETAAAETALMKLDAELAAWQNLLDRHHLVVPGLESIHDAPKRVRVEDTRVVDDFVLPVPKIDVTSDDSMTVTKSSQAPSIVAPLRAVVAAVC